MCLIKDLHAALFLWEGNGGATECHPILAEEKQARGSLQ